MKNFHLHLHGRLLAIRFRRNLVDRAFVLAIGKCIGGDDALLFRPELGEVVLIDVDLDLQIVEVGDGDDVAFGALVADESGGDKFTLLDVAFQNRAGDRSTDYGICEIVFRKSTWPLACSTKPRAASISSWREPMRTRSKVL